MKPGDLVIVDPADWAEGDEQHRRVVLTAIPAPFDKESNRVTAQLQKDEMGLVIAITLVENASTKRGRWDGPRGTHVEALVLFGTRLGWNDAQCFSVI